MDVLRVLDNQIAARCAATTAQVEDWPCRSGCDHCCRHLAREPLLTLEEWLRLQPRLTAEIRERNAQLQGPPFVCPFLHQHNGACGVYEQRPIACRTYGFYVERDQGLYCHQIRERVESGEFAQVTWGNQTAIDRRLDELGGRRTLSHWIATTIDKR